MVSVPKFRVQIEQSVDPGTAIKAVDGGGHLMVPFTARFTEEDETVALELVIDVIDGVPDCTSYTVTALDNDGLARRVGEVMLGVKIREAVAQALQYMVLVDEGERKFVDALPLSTKRPDGTIVESPWPTSGQRVSLELIDKVRGAAKRTTKPTTDAELIEFRDRYRARTGSIERFAFAMNMEPRTVYRWKKKAIERGFLEEGE